ncbi:hypothetical protein [Tahibacter sp.]|uniref:hypothetical protein n=1 Tax=Tahibacter sp. TaxID=2056211 RepID=UPI0028C4A1FF|nr:hypothetical protein [Tahibacter sp.]
MLTKPPRFRLAHRLARVARIAQLVCAGAGSTKVIRAGFHKDECGDPALQTCDAKTGKTFMPLPMRVLARRTDRSLVAVFDKEKKPQRQALRLGNIY